jgi:hypothetical protein
MTPPPRPLGHDTGPAAVLRGDLVELDRRGAALVLAALDVARWAATRNGAAGMSAAYRDLYTVCRLLVNGCPPATSTAAWTATLPASGQLVTVAQAAGIWQCSPQAIRKAITAGHLHALRYGHQWLLSEYEVRHQAAQRASGHGKQPGAGATHRRDAGQADPAGCTGLGEARRAG